MSSIVCVWSIVWIYVKLFLNSDSFSKSAIKLNHFCSFLWAYISINSWAISVASCFAFWIFFSHVTQPSPVNFGFSAHKYLPVAIANSIGQLSPLLLFFWTFLLIEGETPTLQELGLVGIILLGLIILNLSKYNFDHLEKNTSRGFLFAFLGILFGSISVSMMVKSSELSNPYAVAYFWESMIGIFFLITYFFKKKLNLSEKENIPEVIRVFVGKKDAKFPTKKQAFQIAIAASPTIVASAVFVTAVGWSLADGISLTPGSVSAITSAMGAITGMTLAWFLYKEKLSRYHFAGIFCILVGIGAMQVMS